MSPERLTRRAALRAGLLAGASALAGCFDGASPQNSPSPDPPAAAAIRDVAVEGAHLVVDWREDRTVSAANLIGPDGQTFAEADVPAGETTTEIRLLDIDPGVGGYDHYDPGEYELVAVTDDGQDSMAVALEPDLRITDVEQYRDGDSSSDLGKLAVTVENVGTGPTWVYAITYRDAPNDLVNDPLNGDAGIPRLTSPQDQAALLTEPGSRRTYVGDTTPLILADQENQSCSGGAEMTVLAGVADGSTLERDIRLSIGGDVQSAGLDGQYSCSEVSVEVLDDESNV